MPSAGIDACCLIDLLASGQAEAILRAAGFEWYLPTAVESEVHFIRQYDSAQPGRFILNPVDLSPLTSVGVLQICSPSNQKEQERFIHYAAQFRSDGEAMCLAIAEQRGWLVATDDRKAIRVARQAGLTVVSCPELIKAWAHRAQPDQATLLEVLRNIQVLAQFKPHPALPEYSWWFDELTKISP